MKEDSDRKRVEKSLESDSLEDGTVLEVGCGDGRTTSLLADRPKLLGTKMDNRPITLTDIMTIQFFAK